MGDDHAVPRGTLGTVHNAAALLQLMSSGSSHQQLTDLADRSGMSLATVHRLLRSLTAAGLAEQDPRSSRYGLGPELVRLAESYLSRHPVLVVASPYLVELRNSTHETVHLGTLAGEHLVLLDRIDGERAGGVYRTAGRVFDPTKSALGRILLSHDDDAWARLGVPAGFSETDRKTWSTASAVVHVPESSTDPADVAAALRDPDNSDDHVTVGISVVTQDLVGPDELDRTVRPLVERAALTMARALGGR